MISIEKAREIIKKNLSNRKTCKVSLEDAVGYILAEDIVASDDSPRFTNSKMDGFACRYKDIMKQIEEGKCLQEGGKLKVILKIKGESWAGNPFEGKLETDEAVKISTGAMLPEDADIVIPVENTQCIGNKVVITKEVEKSTPRFIRFKGSEFKKNTVIVKKGTKIMPQHVGLIASQGKAFLNVYRKPGVSIFTTGNEVLPYDFPFENEIKPYQLRNANLPMLESAVTLSGGEIIQTGHLADDLNITVLNIQKALRHSDIVIFSGGVSMGEHDYVRDAAEKCGLEPIFWRVKQKPGKPLFFAKDKNGRLFFGLPGNSVSSFMCYIHYIHPVINYFKGLSYKHRRVRCKLKKEIFNENNRFHLSRIRIIHKKNQEGQTREMEAVGLVNQDSHRITSISEADGYTIIPPETKLNIGENIVVYPFPWGNNNGLC